MVEDAEVRWAWVAFGMDVREEESDEFSGELRDDFLIRGRKLANTEFMINLEVSTTYPKTPLFLLELKPKLLLKIDVEPEVFGVDCPVSCANRSRLRICSDDLVGVPGRLLC